MADTDPVAQWIAPQTEADTLQENRELQAENRGLTHEKMAWVEERFTLKNKYDTITEKCAKMAEKQRALESENRGWREKYDRLNKEHENYKAKTAVINTRQNQELEEARTLLAALREALAEKDNLIREMRVTKEVDDLRACLLKECYDRTTEQLDLIKVFNYCKKNRISVNVLKGVLTSDHRATLTLPKKLDSLVGEDSVKEFFDAIVAALPNLQSITGYFKSVRDCYTQYKQGNVPRKVLEAYCAGYGRPTYELSCKLVRSLGSSKLSVSEYLSTVLPLLPQVTEVTLYETNITTLDWCAALPT
ncbi:hypothetical protein ADEAN_000190100 [Angomonas deanei]|uniref:Uncharacterized protein n=1 Tax=Angomonas deanei TaxID=59799 RepID=A0A7G2C4M6_9TRYP|nr:hypothetical protein ADEAN_000190100 [Angomonas deanei]